MSKALLIHVGADSTNLGHYGLDIDGQKYLFVPIPEDEPVVDCKIYEDLKFHYLPASYRNYPMHIDPDLENFTYGEPHYSIRASQLRQLCQNDLLVFVSSLLPSKFQDYPKGNMAKYIIGYFAIKEILHCVVRRHGRKKQNVKLRASPMYNKRPLLANEVKRILKNAHCKRYSDHFTCVLGNMAHSSITRPLRITKFGAPFDPSGLGKKLFGNKRFPQGFKWINDDKQMLKLREILNV